MCLNKFVLSSNGKSRPGWVTGTVQSALAAWPNWFRVKMDDGDELELLQAERADEQLLRRAAREQRRRLREDRARLADIHQRAAQGAHLAGARGLVDGQARRAPFESRDRTSAS